MDLLSAPVTPAYPASLSMLIPKIQSVCERYPVTYIKNESNYGNSSANINNALNHASGDLVKILFQDDFFAQPESLNEMVETLEKSGRGWLATGCIHSDEHSLKRWESTFRSLVVFGTGVEFGSL